jgi:rod shape-determining protein MreC
LFFFGTRKILYAIAIFIFMGLCGWLWRHREAVPFASPASTATAPFTYTVSRGALAVRTGIALIDQYLDQWEELETLRRENGAYRAEQAAYAEILAENARLRELAGFRQGYKRFSVLGAHVMQRDTGAWTDTAVVDRGEESGITKYMPVIVPEGLVGFVSEVYADSSRVQLITDPRTSVSALVQRPKSRIVSLLKGNGSRADTLTFTGLARDADILKGDVIITSGYGGVYPHGLLIGTITSVDDTKGEAIRNADVTPAADLRSMEEVFIITNYIERSAAPQIEPSIPLKEPPMNPNVGQAEVH